MAGELETAKDQVIKSLSAIGVVPVVLVLLLFSLVFFFQDEIGSFFQFSADVRETKTDVSALKVNVAELQEADNQEQLDIIELQDFRGDMTGRVDRLEKLAEENKEKHTDQIGRAKDRIGARLVRDKRIADLEEESQDHDERLDDYERRLLKLELQK